MLPGWPALADGLEDGLEDALEDELLLELEGDGRDGLLLDGLELETLGEELDELGLDGEGTDGALLDDEELDGEGIEGMLDDDELCCVDWHASNRALRPLIASSRVMVSSIDFCAGLRIDNPLFITCKNGVSRQALQAAPGALYRQFLTISPLPDRNYQHFATICRAIEVPFPHPRQRCRDRA